MSSRFATVLLSALSAISLSASEPDAPPLPPQRVASPLDGRSININDDSPTEPAGNRGVRSILLVDRHPNGRVKTAREVVVGSAGPTMLHGEWKSYTADGRMEAHGHYIRNKRHGVWNRWYFDRKSAFLKRAPYGSYQGPFISQALFRAGKIHGYWIVFDNRQRKISQFVFMDGKRHGPSTWWYPNGAKKQEIYYRDGMPHGLRIRFDSDGKITQRDRFEQGSTVEQQVSHYESGAKKSAGPVRTSALELRSADDWWNGRFATYVARGEAEKHGEWRKWHSNGRLQVVGEYRDGRPEGAFVWHSESGTLLSQGSYSDGRQDGRWRWWHANGKPRIEGVYRSGQATGEWTWWDVGGRVSRTKNFDLSGPVAEAAPVPPSVIR